MRREEDELSLGGVLAVGDDDVGGGLRLAGGPVLEDREGAVGVASLGIEGRSYNPQSLARSSQREDEEETRRLTRVVSDHAVSVAGGSLHGPPAVVLRRRLLVPHVSGVSGNVSRLERGGDVLGDAERTSGGVDDPGALLEVREGLLAERCTAN